MDSDFEFYQRRLAEELFRAENEPTEALRELHRGWAELYRERLRKLACPNIVMAA
jgi:hypothetical protein